MQREHVLAAAVGALVEFLLHRHGEARLHVLERDAILRALRTGKRRLDLRQLELEDVGEDRIGRRLGAVQALRLGIGGDQRNPLGGTAGVAQIGDGLVVDRAEAAGGAVFRRHVAEGGAIGDPHGGEAGTEELDELADHAALAQHLRDGEHEVGRGDAFLELAGEFEADHFRQQHRIGLAEHRGLRLDAADAPAQHREAVHHGGVGVGADQRVGIGDVHRHHLAVDLDLVLPGPDRLRQVFEIDLVADAGAGRHHAEIVERLLRPLQELVALLVLLVFVLDVLLERSRRSEMIHRHRMVDDEVDRHQRIDLLRIAAEVLHRVAHGGEIDHRRDAGEVLHQHARRTERNFTIGGLGLQPLRERLQVLLGDAAPVFVAQQILQQHLHRERQPGNSLEPVLLRGDEAINGVGLAADLERLAAPETVE